MSDPFPDSRKELPRNESRDSTDLIIDEANSVPAPPPGPGEIRFMEELRERYLRNLAYREAQKGQGEPLPKPEA